jgi:hypothetical protein
MELVLTERVLELVEALARVIIMINQKLIEVKV